MSAMRRAEIAGDYKYIETCKIYKLIESGEITQEEASMRLGDAIGDRSAANLLSLWNKGAKQ